MSSKRQWKGFGARLTKKRMDVGNGLLVVLMVVTDIIGMKVKKYWRIDIVL